MKSAALSSGRGEHSLADPRRRSGRAARAAPGPGRARAFALAATMLRARSGIIEPARALEPVEQVAEPSARRPSGRALEVAADRRARDPARGHLSVAVAHRSGSSTAARSSGSAGNSGGAGCPRPGSGRSPWFVEMRRSPAFRPRHGAACGPRDLSPNGRVPPAVRVSPGRVERLAAARPADAASSRARPAGRAAGW